MKYLSIFSLILFLLPTIQAATIPSWIEIKPEINTVHAFAKKDGLEKPNKMKMHVKEIKKFYLDGEYFQIINLTFDTKTKESTWEYFYSGIFTPSGEKILSKITAGGCDTKIIKKIDKVKMGLINETPLYRMDITLDESTCVGKNSKQESQAHILLINKDRKFSKVYEELPKSW